jgi:hypothetical protein
MSQTLTHQPLSAIHVEEREWETLRWPGQWSIVYEGRFNMTARRPLGEENVER